MSNPLEELTLDELRERTSVKWRAYPPDVLPLFVAEMDVSVAPPVRRAVEAALERGDTGYPIGTDYAEAFRDFAKERWGWTFDVGATALVADVMTGIARTLELLTDPGDAVVVNSPVYTPFYQFTEMIGRRVVESPLGPDLRIDLEHLEETFARVTAGGSQRAAYLLCSPHNPTGTVHTEAELTAVIELAMRHQVRIVVDEIHAPLVYPGAQHVPFLSMPGAERAFCLVSASKAWNLAGIKSALAVAGEDAVADLRRLPEVVSHGASHLGVVAHAAALREGGLWLDNLVAGLAENRLRLGNLLEKHLPQVRYTVPDGTYLAWLDCRDLGLGNDPADAFLESARVALVPGPAFGTGGDGHARLNFATSAEILEEAVRRMGAVTGPSAAGG